jgi:hypothetical protein
MDPATLTAADYTVVDANGAAVAGFVTSIAPATSSELGCNTYMTSCGLRVRAPSLPPGKYTFTMKAGAEVSDIFGAKYTQAADKKITFEVKEAVATPPVPCL